MRWAAQEDRGLRASRGLRVSLPGPESDLRSAGRRDAGTGERRSRLSGGLELTVQKFCDS